ncbi:bifunctional diguanylate cyclase/phosphodiesterase [Massilia horti]|uniref:EAL domain-containing protein n=1 Tax=Massilia horti TaxID=2562153 RepID=A0A4Y9T2N9_9BURK|nr:EAL domain-containing protein [Massilia horti]TFW31310.1 EAL domain-containing protein [Massilia horti]
MARLRYRPKRLIVSTALDTLGANLRPLLAWLVFCALLIAAVWSWTLAVVEQDRQDIRNKLRETAAIDAQAYAGQLGRLISQIDYIMLYQKYQWEKTGGARDLDGQRQAGLLPASPDIIVTIVDAAGNPVTSTLPFKSNRTNVARLPYFREHEMNPGLGLTIAQPRIGLRLGREVLLISRRLDEPDGGFGGVVVVAIEPDYLAPQLGSGSLEPDDLAAVHRFDSIFLAGPPEAKAAVMPVLKGDSGTATQDGGRYRDGRPRAIAWKKVKGYPLYAVVALSEEQRMRSYGARERELKRFAWFATVLLLLVMAGVAAYLLWSAYHKVRRRELTAAYRVATDNAEEGFFIMRPVYGPNKRIVDFAIQDCNEFGATVAGLPREQLVGQRLSTLRGGAEFDNHFPACLEAFERGAYEDVLRVPHPQTRTVLWLHRRLARSGTGVSVTLRDITAAKNQEQELEQQANMDPLTSLPNRFWLMKHLPGALERARAAGARLAVLFIDLDDFKNLNDTQGHAAGDELLRMAALRLKDVLRDCGGEAVVRLGGDEFTMILPAPGSDGQIAAVAAQVIAQLREPFVLGDDVRYTLGASVGISVFPRDGEDGAALLKHADIAMYAAKGNGKSQYRFFHARLSERLVTRLTLQAELKRAVENRCLALYYQPRVHAGTGKLTSMEALVRWNHPERGIVPPDAFIPVAEATGLILPIGEQVIDMACRQLAEWQAAGVPVVPVSINVSPYQLEQQQVGAVLAAALQRYGIDAALLEVEVTESATVQQGTNAAGEVAAIKALGVKLYVDDFGTGYSSLSQLKRLDMDGLKVDRAFTGSLTHGASDVSLFRAIVSIGHAIGMTIVAEGVETREQLAILQELGCDEVQGYFISRPVPAADALALFGRRTLFPATPA